MDFPILQASAVRAIEMDNGAANPTLMERAGVVAAKIVEEMLVVAGVRVCSLLIVAGPGNNGGDAFVVARLLKGSGCVPADPNVVRVLYVGDPLDLPADARGAHSAWLAAGGECLSVYPAGDFDLLVDGLFGIGLSRPITGLYADWIEKMNASGSPILALDIPSGLNADTGQVSGPVVRADRTVTFIALKPGLLTGDGPEYCGQVSLDSLDLQVGCAAGEQVVPALFRHCLLPRLRNSHKGNFGNVAIVGGAPGMAGAALLAGRAALKLGAGRVYLGMLESLAIDLGQPELMSRTPAEAINAATVLAIGPGLGNSAQAVALLADAIASELPLIVDADGLNLLAQEAMLAQKVAVRPAATFITPHPAEAARLLGCTTAEIQCDRLFAARELARCLRVHVALKGCGTIIIAPGGRWFINATGNPGLATAGSGDVLTGILAALLAQGWPALESLLAAVYLHGASAEACVAAGQGPVGLSAGELIDPARKIVNDWIYRTTPGARISPDATLTG